MSFSGKWMELEIIMLFKISQVQKVKYPMFLFIVEPRPKMMIVVIIIIMTIGYECI
jgi:hypothetical protein